MQRVGAIVVLFVVVSQLEAKLASTDQGQAPEVTVGRCFLSAAVGLFRSFRWLVSRTLELV